MWDQSNDRMTNLFKTLAFVLLLVFVALVPTSCSEPPAQRLVYPETGFAAEVSYTREEYVALRSELEEFAVEHGWDPVFEPNDFVVGRFKSPDQHGAMINRRHDNIQYYEVSIRIHYHGESQIMLIKIIRDGFSPLDEFTFDDVKDEFIEQFFLGRNKDYTDVTSRFALPEGRNKWGEIPES
jgi:hypothetical protein